MSYRIILLAYCFIAFCSEAYSSCELASDEARYIINLTIGNADNTTVDKTRIVFNDAKSLEYELDCDASKFLSSSLAYQIYSMGEDGEKYSINERPIDDGIVPLCIIVKTAGEVKISATRMDREVTLVDKEQNIEYDLSNGAYTFTSAKGTFANRFELHTPVPCMLGDVNGDGQVSVVDAVGIVNFVIKANTDDLNKSAADVNQDGTVSVVDAVKVINSVIHIE